MLNSNYYLGIETSQLATSIAISRGTEILGFKLLSQEQNQRSRLLVSEIQTLLLEQQLTPVDLERIFVSLGPGSFTGLRIGIMVAKTICYAAKVEIKGLPTFQILADKVPFQDQTLIVVSDAQRGDVFLQEYQHKSAAWVATGELSILNWNSLCERYQNPGTNTALLTGPALYRFTFPASARLEKTPAEIWLPTADQTILTGLQSLASTDYSNLFQMSPIYVRPSAAEEKLQT